MNIKLAENAYMPERAHEQDAGLDIRTPVPFIIYPNGEKTINTGVCVELPKGTVGYIKGRSSLFKRGLVVDGTIDEGYTGEIRVVLWNIGKEAIPVKRGDKIAQLVIHEIKKPRLRQVESLSKSERGDGGFGSTGR